MVPPFQKEAFKNWPSRLKAAGGIFFFLSNVGLLFQGYFRSLLQQCLHNIYAWLVYSFNVAVVCLKMALKRKVLFYENEALGRLQFFGEPRRFSRIYCVVILL